MIQHTTHEGNQLTFIHGNRMNDSRMTWQRDCDCKATATTNTLHEVSVAIGPYTIPYRYVFIPGSSCDACGKAWKVVDEK